MIRLLLALVVTAAHAHLATFGEPGCRNLTGELADGAPHALELHTSLGKDQGPRLADYVTVLDRVFVKEGGWEMGKLPEPEDLTQSVTVARIDGKPAASARGDMLGAKFEIADLFPEELAHPLLRKFESSLGYVSRVAVTPEWRGRKIVVPGIPHPVSVAQAVMYENIAALHARGAKLIYLAADARAVSFYVRLGFRVIDAPKDCDGHSAVKMALVVNDLPYLEALDSPLRYVHSTTPTLTAEETAARDLFIERNQRLSPRP